MITCYESGTLRAYLDDEVPGETKREIVEHLAGCFRCRDEIASLETLDHEIAAHLSVTEATARSTDAALAEVLAKANRTPKPTVTPLARIPRHRRRRMIGGALAAAILLALLFVPQVRVAADQLLSVFRAQNVAYVSVSPSRVQQLERLSTDGNALFISKPSVVGTPPSRQETTSLAQAAAWAGFTPQAVHSFGNGPVSATAPTSTTYTVQGQAHYQFQVNVQTLRSILTTLGVTDVQIPDALGKQPVNISLPPAIMTQYTGQDYTLTLIQGESPTVDLPAGVDLTQLGRAALEVYGMSPQQAASLSGKIDWASTLVFPFPTGTSNLQQVDINGAQGVMLDASHAALPGERSASQGANGSGQQPASQTNGAGYVLYWQQGTHFYILSGSGAVGPTFMAAAASSVR